MSAGRSEYASASASSSVFGSPPRAKLSPAEAHSYLEEGLQGAKRHSYRSATSFVTTIIKCMKEFQFGGAAQYAVYSPVTHEEFTKVADMRNRDLKGLRFLYLTDERTLIVKFIVGESHEIAHRRFIEIVMRKAIMMGLRMDFIDIGKTRFSGIGSQKEGDTAFKPTSRPLATDWPTLVFECGVSESLQRLRVDARWWLENSEGEVGTVVLVTVSKEERSLHVEQWELADMPKNPDVAQANPDPFIIGVKKTGEVDIVGEVVTGAPLKISFKKTMLRDYDEALGEGDFVLDVQDFKEVARILWRFS